MTPKTYLVGGAVRDLYLNTQPKDKDYVIETSDYNIARNFITSQLGCKIVQERQVYKVFRAVSPNNEGLDFALPRLDFENEGRGCKTIPVESIEKDLSRRDFTFNAMALEVDFNLNIIGDIIDPFGGLKDLKNKLVRLVGNPYDRIEEDHLRVLRALRFALRFNFTFETETFKAIQGFQISDVVSSERIFEELNKMFIVSNTKTIEILNLTQQLYLLDRIKLTATT